MEAQCKDGVRDDGAASLIVAAEERLAELRVCACVYERERARARDEVPIRCKFMCPDSHKAVCVYVCACACAHVCVREKQRERKRER